ncbi:MAG TPA: cysteine desulfurase-like protein [Lacipirellulaceae bacterium]|jgi:cysteine desulfurase family protein (TIGR01976 family)|nr:cysteine desulfurase-like protein [Lacipirellulaceae bacterium]
MSIETRPRTADPNTSSTTASIENIRAQFPALGRMCRGNSVAYFDGPGGTQVPQSVVDSVSDYLLNHNANTHWNYPSSHETDEILDSARVAFSDFLGGSPAEIVFGANATSLAFHVSRALARQISAGDEVVITELDHHANVGPWQALSKECGCTLRAVQMNPANGTLDWNDLEQKITPKTKLVAIGAASNALGTITDVQKAATLAREVGALIFVDAVHYAPHHLVDVRGMDCDFLVCSAYKFYGPHVGALWCREGVLRELQFAKVAPSSNIGPERAETGTLNHEGIAGAASAVDFLASLSKGSSRRKQLAAAMAAIHERCARLTRQMWEGLEKIKGVQLFGPRPDEPRTSTVAFTVAGIASSEVARRLAEEGIFVSHGNFYAATVVERLGLGTEGLVRAGCACYTTADEVSRLIEGVQEMV